MRVQLFQAVHPELVRTFSHNEANVQPVKTATADLGLQFRHVSHTSTYGSESQILLMKTALTQCCSSD